MSENTANRIFNTVNVILIVIAMVLCLAPFIHIIAISLSSNRAIGSGEVSFFPKELSWEAYGKVFGDGSMIRSLIYTIWLTVLSTVLSMLMTIMAKISPCQKQSERPQMVHAGHCCDDVF